MSLAISRCLRAPRVLVRSLSTAQTDAPPPQYEGRREATQRKDYSPQRRRTRHSPPGDGQLGIITNESVTVSGMYNALFPGSAASSKREPRGTFLANFVKRADAYNVALQNLPAVNRRTTVERKQEEMSACENDEELVRWTATQFRRLEVIQSLRNSSEFASRPDANELMAELEAYPEIISSVMRTFRDRYRDPHLALAVFDHVRHQSTPSYVCGCKTSSYNELLVTLWTCFGDLRGVAKALREMKVNGVEPNWKTRELAEGITGSALSNSMMKKDESAFRHLQDIEQLSGWRRTSPSSRPDDEGEDAFASAAALQYLDDDAPGPSFTSFAFR